VLQPVDLLIALDDEPVLLKTESAMAAESQMEKFMPARPALRS
jgi:hypothetical protein